MRINKIFIVFLLAGLILLGSFALTNKARAGNHEYHFTYKIPCKEVAKGTCPENPSTPAEFVATLYQFSLMIVGLVAFGGLILGGVKYILSAGNIVEQSDARDQITKAIMGLALLLGAFLILRTINPNLVNLKDPGGEILEIERYTRRTTRGGTPTLTPTVDNSGDCGEQFGTCVSGSSCPATLSSDIGWCVESTIKCCKK